MTGSMPDKAIASSPMMVAALESAIGGLRVATVARAHDEITGRLDRRYFRFCIFGSEVRVRVGAACEDEEPWACTFPNDLEIVDGRYLESDVIACIKKALGLWRVHTLEQARNHNDDYEHGAKVDT